MAAGFVGEVLPPVDAVAAGFVHGGGAAGSGEADIHPELANGAFRIAAVEDDAAGFILIEAKMNKAAQKVSGLRVALAYGGGDASAQRVGGAGIVLEAVAKVRIQVARGGEADAIDLRIFGGIDKLEPGCRSKSRRVVTRISAARSSGLVRRGFFLPWRANDLRSRRDGVARRSLSGRRLCCAARCEHEDAARSGSRGY